jgi:16S rRNA (cytosine1402-N4)-methyltransferase
MSFHKTVLLEEAIHYLNLRPGKLYIDVTFGGGGHSRKILESDPGCKLIAVDWDKKSLDQNSQDLLEEFPDRFRTVWGNFAFLEKVLKKLGVKSVSGGILADFGTSQTQLLHGTGFSFLKDTFLDMRMSPAHQKITACDIVNNYPEAELVKLFFELGEERASRKIAKAIAEERKKKIIKTTAHLVQVIENVIPSRGKIHPATKTFQALRMRVNNELENIQSFLSSSLKLLEPGGRLVCITFHSLEDRAVKTYFREHKEAIDSKEIDIITRKVVIASPEELKLNPSARSAKLRAVEVI